MEDFADIFDSFKKEAHDKQLTERQKIGMKLMNIGKQYGRQSNN